MVLCIVRKKKEQLVTVCILFLTRRVVLTGHLWSLRCPVYFFVDTVIFLTQCHLASCCQLSAYMASQFLSNSAACFTFPTLPLFMSACCAHSQ